MNMIYENHFSLNQRPFTIAPNPEFLYANGQYQDALAALEYGMIHRGGFVLLTGEVGTGKTTLCKYLLNNIPQDTEVALILHPQLDRLEMLQLICREFDVAFNDEDKELNLIERLTDFLLGVYSKGGYSVLIIDEAQHLDTQVLELVRLLTNLETHKDKLLQIILLGQPELKTRLQRYDMRQLDQRFTARFHLKPLTCTQVADYINHRVSVAGNSGRLFSPLALWLLHKLSGGIPRLVNLIADRSLMGGYALDRRSINSFVVHQAAKEVLPEPSKGSSKKWIAGFCLLIMVIAGLGFNKTETFMPQTMHELESLLSMSSSTSDDSCFESSGCWQGYLPARLIQDDSVLVKVDGEWLSWNSGLNQKGLIQSRIMQNQPFEGLAVKPNSRNGIIPWVRTVLDRWAQSGGGNDDGDTTHWQVIKPDIIGNYEFVDDRIYDVALEGHVRQFQQEYHLTVDGVIGLQTLISLKLLDQALGEE